MAKKFLVSPGRCYVVTGPVGTTITAKDGTIVNSIVTGSTQCSFIPSVNEVTVDPDTAKLEQVSRGIAVRSSNNGGGGGGGSTVDDWITVNDVGEAVLNFPEEPSPQLELLSLGGSRFTKITGNTGGKTNCRRLLYGLTGTLSSVDIDLPAAENINEILYNSINITSFSVRAPKATSGMSAFGNIYKTTSAHVEYPEMINASSMFTYLPELRDCYFSLPKCTNAKGFFSATGKYITTLSFNLASLATITLVSTSGAGGLGTLTTLQNLTILDGGLAACTSFNVSTSTNLTDASIQNIIDALPDYSGTETSALVSFPPNRLTAEQQAQLSNKGWTWS